MNILDYYPEKKYYASLKIIKKLNDIGFLAYYVGGSVRDAILCKEVKDIDIATNAKEELINSIFKNQTVISEKYKVIKLKIEDEIFELSSFRKDGAYLDGRHPVFTGTGSIEEDAARRDFTMNAVYFDPILYEFKDYFTGISDINKKIIRVIGNPNIRFKEDKLRILRAVRFASELDFIIEEKTYFSMLNTINKLEGISKERILEEFNRILLSKTPSNALTYLYDLNILNLLFPELIKLKETYYVGNISYWDCVLRFLDNLETKSLLLAWSFLCVFLKNYFDIKTILKRFNFSNTFILDIDYIVNKHEMLLKPEKLDKLELKKIINYRLFDQQLCFLKLYLKILQLDFKPYNYLVQEKTDFEKNYPPLFIDGEYLKTIGILDTKNIKYLLNNIYKAQLEGRIKNKQEAKLFLNTLIKKNL